MVGIERVGHGGAWGPPPFREGRLEPWPCGTRMQKPEDHLPFDEARGYRIVDELVAIAGVRGFQPSQVALRYLLRKPGVTSLMFGARSRTQLEENLMATDCALSDEDIAMLDEVSHPSPIYPHWYFEIYRKERMDKAQRRGRIPAAGVD